MTAITVVTYLWGVKYREAHVQRLQRSVAAWLTLPHRFVCVTRARLRGVETLADPVALRFPSRCYRRLWLFSPEAQALGPRLLHLDLDVVVCGSLDALVTRPAPFSIYRSASIGASGYSLNPSVMVLEPGTQADIWTHYVAHPRVAIRAGAAGFWGSDQAVIGYLRQGQALDTIGEADGVWSYRQARVEQWHQVPAGARVVSFHGRGKPFDPLVQRAHPWIQQAWQAAA